MPRDNPSRPNTDEGTTTPTPEQYADWLMQLPYPFEMRISHFNSDVEIYGQKFRDQDLAARPEIMTQKEHDKIDFPRHMNELVSMLWSQPDGFAEIYLTKKQFDANAIERLAVSSGSMQITTGFTQEEIKDIILNKYPRFQTSENSSKAVDLFLGRPK